MTTKEKIKECILDLIFPRFCVGCHAEGTWLCSDCESKILHVKTSTCILCQRLSDKGICPNCRRRLPITGSICAGYYRDPILKEAIHVLKYEGVRELAKPLAQLLYERLNSSNLPSNSVIVPVPLHRWREASRGFNQTVLIANRLSTLSGLPVKTDWVKRVRSTEPQIELSPSKRAKNIERAFEVRDNKKIIGKTILLLDDVITTGSTIGECARVFRAAGVNRIYAIALARG